MRDEGYVQANRLHASLSRHADERAAGEIAGIVPLNKTPGEKKRFQWAKAVCAALEGRFDDCMIRQIRMDCACGPSRGRMDEIKRIYEAAADLQDFAARYNAANLGSSIELDGGASVFSYPKCYCSCVNKVDEPISRTWCYCTLGYASRLFEYALGCPVDVELLETVKSGGSRCAMRVTSRA